MSKKINFVGIDVSAKELVTTIQKTDGTITECTFDNTYSGHKKLLKFVTKNSNCAKVCMESTGIYHFDAAITLASSDKIDVMIVNPKAMKHFGIAMMQRAKTDKIDSRIILEYLLRMDFKEWIVPDDKTLQIQAIARRICQLKKQLTAEQNRNIANNFKRKSSCKLVGTSLNGSIKYLQKDIAKLQTELSEMIKAVPELAEQYKLLNSIKGVGEVSSSQILSEFILMPDDLEAKQLVAFAGLDPRVAESGTSVNKKRKISKRGNKFLRSALYMPALVAVRHDPNVKEYYEKLLNAGKTKRTALVAVMRKLLLAIWGMLRSGTTWQGEKFYRIPEDNA